MTTTGGCLCGAIRYEVSAPPLFQGVCHCRDCQYVSGGAPANVMVVPKTAITVIKGQTRTYWVTGDSGGRVGREFCEVCGTQLFSNLEPQPAIAVIKAGSLDDPSQFAPSMQIWTGSAQPWHHIDAALPAFEKGPGA